MADLDEVYGRVRQYFDNGFNFNDGNEMVNFAKIIAQTILLMDNNADEIALSHIIDEAVGLQLDNIGDDLQQPRYGRNDDDYRFLLKTKIIAANSSGTTNDIITIICNSLGADPTTSGIVVNNDYQWNGSKMIGEPQVVDVQSLPTSLVTSSQSLQVLMDRLGSATVADVIIKAVNFINGSTSQLFTGVAVYEVKNQTIPVQGGN